MVMMDLRGARQEQVLSHHVHQPTESAAVGRLQGVNYRWIQEACANGGIQLHHSSGSG